MVSYADVIEKRSSDITVLSASTSMSISVSAPYGINLGSCQPIPNSSLVDCTKELSAKAGAPSIHSLVMMNDFSQFYCRLLTVHTVTVKEAAQNATGIGFFYSGYGSKGRFIPKSELKKVGEVTLCSGHKADIHEFSGVANCWAGTASSSQRATYVFRPYVEFLDEQGNQYHNWDNTERDYLISPVFTSFSRESELILN